MVGRNLPLLRTLRPGLIVHGLMLTLTSGTAELSDAPGSVGAWLDTVETIVAWSMAIAQANRPSALLLSRQNLPYLPKDSADEITQGAYVLSEPQDVGMKKAKAVIVASGSEVALALRAQELLAQDGIGVRVVSMPSSTVFDRQPVEVKLENIKRFHFSAHAPRKALKRVVERLHPKNVIYVHGDPDALRWMQDNTGNGARTFAPTVGQTIMI